MTPSLLELLIAVWENYKKKKAYKKFFVLVIFNKTFKTKMNIISYLKFIVVKDFLAASTNCNIIWNTAIS